MTVLSAIQDAAMVLGLEAPAAVFSSGEREAQELAALANEMAERLNREYDWEDLKRLHTYTGNGTSIAFDLPPGYSRMARDQRMWGDRRRAPLRHVTDADEWLGMTTRRITGIIPAWTKIGGQVQFLPPLGMGERVSFYFITDRIARGADGEHKNRFTADTDSFRLDERLLRLGMVWQWRANKGLSYGEDMANYEAAKAERIMRDRIPQSVSIGRPRWPAGVDMAYPESIIP